MSSWFNKNKSLEQTDRPALLSKAGTNAIRAPKLQHHKTVSSEWQAFVKWPLFHEINPFMAKKPKKSILWVLELSAALEWDLELHSIYEFKVFMNSYMNMTLWIHMLWIRIWIWHYEFMVFEFMYMNSEHTLNSYTWIQTTWIHSVIFIYEFIVFSEFIYMNSDTMNS